jgi:hypothetical protein
MRGGLALAGQVARSVEENGRDFVRPAKFMAIPQSNKNKQFMKNKTYLISGVCVATIAFCLPLTAQTIPRTPSSPSPSPRATASPSALPSKQITRPIPFHGMILSVDRNAKTFTIAGKNASRTFQLTDKTSITKGGNTVSMQDIVENEEARGSYWKNPDGTFQAKTVKLGSMSAAEKTKEGAKKTKSSTSPAASATASPAKD